MHRIVIALLIIAAVEAPAVAGEDAAHRADRLRTEQLNRRAGAVVDRRNGRNAAGQERYRQARADYALKMHAWRRQVAACRAGDYSACDRR
jgi:Ni/Co efflux regulator RcnB